MTLDELEKLCDQCEARYDNSSLAKLSGEPKFQLVIKGLRDGDRARVMPGVMGQVLGHCGANETVVLVKVADVRKAIERARAGGAA